MCHAFTADEAADFDDAMSGAPAGGGSEQVLAGLRTRWAALARPNRVLGAPPPWARRADYATRLAALIPPGTDPGTLATWRRKLILKNKDAPRPPYYGSWSKTRWVSDCAPLYKPFGARNETVLVSLVSS